LDLFKYIKFESVYDLLFITHCNMKANNNRKVGECVGMFEKISIGGIASSALLIILIGPLILFSSLNPTNVHNPVLGANIELSFSFQMSERVFNNFSLFKNDYVESITDITSLNDTWKLYNYHISPYTKNFPKSQVQVLNMSSTSDTIWDIAQPHINTIIDRLENYKTYNYNISLNFIYSFKRNVKINKLVSLKCTRCSQAI